MRKIEISRDAAVALGLGAGFGALYLRSLCPTVYYGDSGEIATAIHVGGVIHPPGYPLFGLLGRLALAAIPWGEPAFRIGCVVALAAAAAVAVLFRLARELGAARWAAAIAAAGYGVSYTYWSQSVRVEVYSLHVLLAGLLLWFAARYRRQGRPRDLLLAALAGSLGLAHHLTIVLVGIPAAVLSAHRFWRAPRRGRLLAGLLAVLAIGPLFYLLLVVWARSEPLLAWGNPVDLPSLWNHATAKLYQSSVGIPTPWQAVLRLATAGRLLGDNFHFLAWALLPLGAIRLWRRDRAIAATLFAIGLLVTGYNLCYRIGDIAGYYLVVWFVGALLIAHAAEAVRARWLRPTWGIAALAIYLVALPLVRNWPACDLSGATWVREFARHKLEGVPPHGVLIVQGDHDAFPIWYAQHVLQIRTDVITLDRVAINGSIRRAAIEPSLWYFRYLRRRGVPVPLDLPADRQERIPLMRDGLLIRILTDLLPGRPIATTFLATGLQRPGTRLPLVAWAEQRFELVPVGIVVRFVPKQAPTDLAQLIAENEAAWARITLPRLERARTDQELDPGYVRNHYACMLVNFGHLYELAGDWARAETIYRRAATWNPDFEPAAAALAQLHAARAAQPPAPTDRSGI